MSFFLEKIIIRVCLEPPLPNTRAHNLLGSRAQAKRRAESNTHTNIHTPILSSILCYCTLVRNRESSIPARRPEIAAPRLPAPASPLRTPDCSGVAEAAGRASVPSERRAACTASTPCDSDTQERQAMRGWPRRDSRVTITSLVRDDEAWTEQTRWRQGCSARRYFDIATSRIAPPRARAPIRNRRQAVHLPHLGKRQGRKRRHHFGSKVEPNEVHVQHQEQSRGTPTGSNISLSSSYRMLSSQAKVLVTRQMFTCACHGQPRSAHLSW